MSTIFGIYNRSEKPVKAEILQKMHVAMSYWLPDESGDWHRGAVALGHEMLWNAPESKLEHLPAKRDHLVITMDARLDNREALAKQLDMADRPLQQIADSELILAAYCQWGEECPKYLLGDFAFAIWDDKKQHLFCVRDHLGIRPFYFHLSDTLFLFANDLKGLVAHPDISNEMSDEAVANYFVHSLLISPSRTFFKEIQKLPPAHTLTITVSTVCRQCYWRPEDAQKIILPDAKAYADKLRELLEQAVHDRLRSDYSITSHLSGGLDSSTIAVIAARKLREQGEKLLAFNWVPQPAANEDPTHYEWANSKTTADTEGISHSYVSISTEDIAHFMSNHNITYGDSAGFWYEYPVRKAAQKKNSRTILSGWGGDELCTYHGHSFYANMLKEGNVVTLLRELRRVTHKKKNPVRSFLRFVYHQLLIPFVPRRFYCKMPKNKCIERSSFQFVKKEFLPVVNREKNKTLSLTMQPQRTIREHMLAYLQHGHLQGRIESWVASSFNNRLEYSYPLLDKRIVEFVLGVPAKYFVHNGTGRYLFRSAAEGILPEKILWAHKKPESHRVDRSLSMSYSAYKLIIQDMSKRNVGSNYADFSKIEGMVNTFSQNVDMIEFIPELGNVLLILQSEKNM